MWAKASSLSKSFIGDAPENRCTSLARCAWSANPQSQASDAHFSFRSGDTQASRQWNRAVWESSFGLRPTSWANLRSSVRSLHPTVRAR